MEAGDADDAFQGVATDTTSMRAAEAFSALSGETRLAILLTLWDAYEPFADDNAVAFTELRKRVGMRDSGQFNYHLDKLVGTFIEATDEGYTLRTAGHKIIQAVVGGVGIEEPTFDAADVEFPCPYCETPTDVTYEDRKVRVTCPACGDATGGDTSEGGKTILQMSFDPAGVAERTAGETMVANMVQEMQKNGMRLFGVCPECSGTVARSFDVCESHDAGPDQLCPHCERSEQVQVRFVCTVCKNAIRGPVRIAAAPHPAVQSFYNEHGYLNWFDAGASTGFDALIETQELFDHDQEILSKEPFRVETAITHESGDAIRVVFNDAVEIVDVDSGA